MNSQNDKEGSGHIKAAVIGGVFVVVAAIITGFFLLINTMVEKSNIVIGAENPNSSPTAITSQGQEQVNSPTQISSNNSGCSAYVTRVQVNELKNVNGVDEALKKAQEYAGYLQIDFRPGDIIPAGVLIATDFLTTDIGQYNLIPINNQGGWGLFETTTEIQATTPGTYRCISE